MGYRNYIGKVKKEKYDELSSLSNKQIVELYDSYGDSLYFNVKEITELEEIHEFGKYCEFDIKKHTKRFFKDKMVFEDDEEFYIASPKFLECVIKDYHNNIINYYNKIMDESDEQKNIYFKSKISEWSSLKPYNLDLNNDVIVDSWKYEYVIFELVRIYKSFDWDNYLLIYYGS